VMTSGSVVRGGQARPAARHPRKVVPPSLRTRLCAGLFGVRRGTGIEDIASHTWGATFPAMQCHESPATSALQPRRTGLRHRHCHRFQPRHSRRSGRLRPGPDGRSQAVPLGDVKAFS
jgi:hypothetical protein